MEHVAIFCHCRTNRTSSKKMHMPEYSENGKQGNAKNCRPFVLSFTMKSMGYRNQHSRQVFALTSNVDI